MEGKNRMEGPDQLDRKIIAILREDGRASNAGIARKVGVSEGTVRRRLKNLVQEEFIQVVALPDAAKMGNKSQALIGVQVDPDKVDVVADALKSLPEVTWVAVTTGSYDVFAWATLPSAEALGIFLRSKVGTVVGVRRTETFVNLDKMRGNVVI
jgi:Lrp/AsnC family transcriptional regulator for asnA, asnC and gidA